ncbi:LD-carboxypeptidase [Crocinitomix sp.]|nr:LD-carboxypeptidase [Crocinitomix sp.]
MKKIRILSPAKQIDQIHVDFAEEFLQKNHFDVEIGTYALGQDHYFSGTIEERLSDFQYAINDPSVDIILCSRGGYGSVQIIDQLDFSAFKEKPKLIVGYSDITVFHNHIYGQLGFPSLHATAPLNFASNSLEALASMLNAINGNANRYEFDSHISNIIGEAEGNVIGGNLAIVYSLLGTNSDVDFTDKILFIEDVGEAIYAIDRMFYAFEKAGRLKQLKGVIVGGLTNMKDSEIPFGITVEEVIQNHIQKYSIPLAFNFPAGHIDDNRAVMIGVMAKIEVGENGSTFEQKFNRQTIL